jgi:cobalt/nickel transport system permease protein
MLLTLVIALCQNYQTAGVGLALAVLLAHFAKLEFRAVFMRLLVVNSFTIFLWLTLPLSYPGTTLVNLGPLTVSAEGITLATLITIKTNAIIVLCIALLATSTIADIGHSLGKLRFPPKLCLLLLFSYRYIFVIHQEFQRLTRAAQLRCFQPGTNMHTYRTYGYLFGMTLLKSWHRGERVSQAMMLRGFDGRFYSLNETAFCLTDIFFISVMCIAAIALASLEYFLPFLI